MRLLDELRSEHELIDGVLGSLRAWVDRRLRGAADPRDGAAFLRFFRLFAGEFHHGREEQLLMPALVEKAELSRERGPLFGLVQQHREMEATLHELGPLLTSHELPPAEASALAAAAVRYSHALWRHIDAENSVLLPESETRLRRNGVLELPVRPIGPEQQAAREEGQELLLRYPPLHDREALRGEGCVVCPSYGSSCRGVEREWWTDEEWDDFFDRVG